MKPLIPCGILLAATISVGYFQHTRIVALEDDAEQLQAAAKLERRRLEIFCQPKVMGVTVEDSRPSRADVANALIAKAELCSQDRVPALVEQFRKDAELLYKTDDKAQFKGALQALMLEIASIERIALH